jgi:hypothetical protein
LLDYAMCTATPDSLFALLEIVEPELVVHAGEHFIAHGFTPDLYDEWMERLSDRRAVQRVMNHLHISSILQNGRVTDRVARAAASAIARAWSTAFASLDLLGEAHGETYGDAEVTLVRRP